MGKFGSTAAVIRSSAAALLLCVIALAQAKSAAAQGLDAQRPGASLTARAARADDSSSLYREAERAFPAFCREWERKLRQREQDNLANLRWSERNGYQTATYVGYGPIESCVCKRSAKGQPVGKIVYREMVYYLVGRTVEEAKRSQPKLIGSTDTVELFNWSGHRWEY